MTEVHVLGIRHHGPGSARAVAEALDEIRPGCVLIEGAPELTEVAPLAAAAGMEPPVAGLVYLPDEPARAAFYPMASFSPEWVALLHTLRTGAAARFIDLPAAHFLGAGRARRTRYRAGDVRLDPLGALAEAAGYTDAERWWEDVVEHRWNGRAVFAEITAAMAALRETLTDSAGPGPDEADDPSRGSGAGDEPDDPTGSDDTGPVDGDDRREAWMRTAIRAALKEGHDQIAVVCGAWHAPVLEPARFPKAAADAALLKGLPKRKVAATWVPWTSGRLAVASGYGAGVESPGWYAHLHRSAPEAAVAGFLAESARLLRAEGFDVSPASVIDAVRLAEATATIRNRPLAGLDEVLEAVRVVLSGGSEVPLRLVRDRLVVGEVIGRVPESTPMVPLARDLAAEQKRLRLPAAATRSVLEVDLRRPAHRDKSRLLHRLALLGIDWGENVETGGTGTFKETWVLEWYPELSVAVIEAAGHGTTVAAAAEAVAAERLAADPDLAVLTGIVEVALKADLPATVAAGVDALSRRAAEISDVSALLAGAEPLARVARYGDVRGGDTSTVAGVLRAVITRAAAGLPAASVGLGPDAAEEMTDLVDSTHRALAVADDADLTATWQVALAATAERPGVAAAVAGRATRLLLDGGVLDAGEAHRRVSRALSRGADAPESAAWLEAFLRGDALLLVHDPDLLATVDSWVVGVPEATFDDVVAVLRRAFSTYTPAERRLVGQHVRRLATGGPAPVAASGIDPERAARTHPRLRELLGTTA